METQREKIMDEIEFGDFVLKYEEEINKIQDMIRQPFENEVNAIEKQIGNLSAKMEFISWCLARAKELLINAQHRALIPKRKDITDTDRRLALDFSTSKETLLVNWLEGVDEKIGKYLDKLQSVLSTERAIYEKAG